MTIRPLGLAALALLLSVAGAAQPKGARTLAGSATLDVLHDRVERVTASGEKSKAADGMSVAAGDRIVTSGGGTALLTFLDGSTATVQPGSDVAVRRLGGGGEHAGLLVNAGAVWARVARLATPAAPFSLESNTATAAVHDGVIGAGHASGEFRCWTQRGDLAVTDAGGRPLITLHPGETTHVSGKQAPHAEPFAVNAMTLRVEASAGVWPLLEMPAAPLHAGFVAPGIEVNQVFGSVTRVNPDGTRVIEVPAGVPGPYTVRIHGAAAGPYSVTMTGLFRGTQAYRLELAGTIARDEWLSTSVRQTIPPTAVGGVRDPTRARAESARAAKFAPMHGDVPGTIRVAPAELEAAR